MFEKINDFIWDIKYLTIKKYKYQNVYTDLKSGYHVSYTRLLYSSMKIFEEYCESLLSNYFDEKDYYKDVKKISDKKEFAEIKKDKTTKILYVLLDLEKNIDIRHSKHWKDFYDIYYWWKKVYPEFLKHDEKNMNDFVDKMNKKYNNKWCVSALFMNDDDTVLNKEENKEWHKLSDACWKAEQKLDKDCKKYLKMLINNYEFLNN